MKIEIHAELITEILVRSYKRKVTTLVLAKPTDDPEEVVTYYSGTFRCTHGRQFNCISTHSGMLEAKINTWYTMSNVTLAVMGSEGPYLGHPDTW